MEASLSGLLQKSSPKFRTKPGTIVFFVTLLCISLITLHLGGRMILLITSTISL